MSFLAAGRLNLAGRTGCQFMWRCMRASVQPPVKWSMYLHAPCAPCLSSCQQKLYRTTRSKFLPTVQAKADTAVDVEGVGSLKRAVSDACVPPVRGCAQMAWENFEQSFWSVALCKHIMIISNAAAAAAAAYFNS
eukprot:1157785-Pelagomonas_calceolata.AAC.6